MRPGRLLGFLAVLALGLAGCGDHSLIVRVDLLSFLTAAETHAHYGPIPAGITDSVTVASSRTINLLPGVRDITTVSDVSVDAVGTFANTSGSGTGVVKIFVSAEGTDPFTADTTPIVLPITLTAGVTDSVAVSVSGDSQLADLFLGKTAEIGIRLTLQSTTGPLEGDFALTTLKAIVTAKQDVIH